MTKRSRHSLTTARRWVLKIGSAILTDNGQGLSHDFITRLAGDVIALREQGREVIIVSSGAVAAGLGRLGLGEVGRERRRRGGGRVGREEGNGGKDEV